jgi:hypothetical protein
MSGGSGRGRPSSDSRRWPQDQSRGPGDHTRAAQNRRHCRAASRGQRWRLVPVRDGLPGRHRGRDRPPDPGLLRPADPGRGLPQPAGRGRVLLGPAGPAGPGWLLQLADPRWGLLGLEGRALRPHRPPDRARPPGPRPDRAPGPARKASQELRASRTAPASNRLPPSRGASPRSRHSPESHRRSLPPRKGSP